MGIKWENDGYIILMGIYLEYNHWNIMAISSFPIY
jgi:hypothetical protein